MKWKRLISKHPSLLFLPSGAFKLYKYNKLFLLMIIYLDFLKKIIYQITIVSDFVCVIVGILSPPIPQTS